MPYGEKSAYDAQAALKKKSPAYQKSSGFKMKSPLPFLDIVEGDKITHKTKVRKKEKTKVTGDKTFSMFSGNKFEE